MRPSIYFLLLFSFNSVAQNISLSFSKDDNIDLNTSITAYPLKYSNGTATYSFGDEKLIVEVKNIDDSLSYAVLCDGIPVEKCVFHKDSVDNWKTNKTYDSHKIMFNLGEDTYKLIPGTVAEYFDPVFNDFPAMLIQSEMWRAGYNDNIDLIIEKIHNRPKDEWPIKVMRDGEPDRKEIIGSKTYKHQYYLGDTLFLADNSYLIENIDWNNKSLALKDLQSKNSMNKIPDEVLLSLREYFGEKEYILLDFFGSWCKPCINNLPQIRSLIEEYGDFMSFLTVIYDRKQNLESAYDILAQNDIHESSLFIDFNEKDSIVQLLKIISFPSYLLLDSDGDLLLLIDNERIEQLKSRLNDLRDEKR